MPNASLPTTQKSPLEFIADEFWQDFMQNRPIDGGVAFEKELKRCQLDGSVASLCRVDAFLAFVGKQNTQKPDLFMTQGQTRNLVLFVGFYVGRILADAWHAYPHWLGQQELKEQHASLPIHPNNPFHFMALSYRPYDLKQGNDVRSVPATNIVHKFALGLWPTIHHRGYPLVLEILLSLHMCFQFFLAVMQLRKLVQNIAHDPFYIIKYIGF